MFNLPEMDHPWLAFGREGGGGSGIRFETPKSTTSGSRLDAREVVVVAGILSWWYSQQTNGNGGMEDKNGEKEPRRKSWLVFSRRTFCPLIPTLPYLLAPFAFSPMQTGPHPS